MAAARTDDYGRSSTSLLLRPSWWRPAGTALRERRLASQFVSECEPGQPIELGLGAFEAAAYTRVAPGKGSGNEDRAAVFPLGPQQIVLAVADGLGGMPAGDEAAQLAIEELGRRLSCATHGDGLRATIIDAVEHANQRILELGVGAGTTLAVVEIDGDRLRTYHVGDSAVLVVGQRGKHKLETIAHSPVGYLVAAGLVDADEALHHHDRHFLSNHVGASDMHIEVGSPIRLAPRDTVLVASDGIFDNFRMSEIIDGIRKGKVIAAARTLAMTCQERMLSEPDGVTPAKPDDATFVLARRKHASSSVGPRTKDRPENRVTSTSDRENAAS